MPVTLKDVAERAGVSLTTASRALGGFSDVAEATRGQVAEAAAELGYVPNMAARRLKRQRTETIALIIPTPTPRYADPFFSDFLAGVGNEAALNDYDLLLSTHPPDSKREFQTYERAAAGGWVDGVIVVRTRCHDRRIQLLHERDFPFVSFGRTEADFNYYYVDEDSHAGISHMVQHLAGLGHTRIGFITPPTTYMFGKHRREGYEQTMFALGLDVAPRWIVSGDMTQRGGGAAMQRLLEQAPELTAVIGGNDLMAFGAMHAAEEAGLVIGRDISIGGFDDVPASSFTSPPLTTSRQPIYEIGQLTCRMLIQLLNGEDPAEGQVLLTPSLIIRESSGPAPA